MAAEAKFRFIGKVTGLGEEKEVSTYALLSDTPTQASGPVLATVNTAIQLLDTIATVSGELVALYIKAHDGNIFIDPFTTAVAVTACNYIPEGQFNIYTYQTTVSAVPSLAAASAGSQIEYFFVSVT